MSRLAEREQKLALDAESAFANVSIKIIKAEWRGGSIMPRGCLRDHQSAIENQRILIFRGAFDGGDMIALRRAVQQWGETAEPFPKGQSASRAALNFHRLDDGSAPSILPHIFHQFGFGDLARLPASLVAILKPISTAMLKLQNELAGTQFELEDGRFRTKVIRHPRGGGFLVRHRHPFQPQRIALFLNLSQPGVDYASGGVTFKAHGAWVEPFDQFRIGDILAWRYDMIHDVKPVDPDRPLSWEGDDGFWIYALEMDEVHKASRAVD